MIIQNKVNKAKAAAKLCTKQRMRRQQQQQQQQQHTFFFQRRLRLRYQNRFMAEPLALINRDKCAKRGLKWATTTHSFMFAIHEHCE